MIHTLDTYNAQYKSLEKKVDEEIGAMDTNPALLMEYTITTLNRHRLLPDEQTDDLDFFRQYLFNKYANVLLDPLLTEPFLNGILEIDGDLSFLEQKQPALFCSFHFGTSVPTAMLLDRLGFDPYVPNITGNELTLKRARDLGDMLVAEVNDNQVVGGEHKPVRKSQQILIDMFLLLREKKSMLFYLDANVGLNELSDRKAPLQFMGQQYLSQKGVSALSYLSQTPIIPVVCYRTGPHHLKVKFGEALRPQASANREVFIQESLQRCYAFLEAHIRERPAQWKSWYLVHKYMNFSAAPSDLSAGISDAYRFNQERYVVCQTSTKNVIMDRQQYGYFPVSGTLGHYLKSIGSGARQKTQVEQQLSRPLLNDLLTRHVLLDC